MENQHKSQANKKIDPLNEVVDVILKSQAKSCVSARKLLELRQGKEASNQ